MFHRVVTVVMVLGLAACAAPHPRRVTVPSAVPGESSLQALPPAGNYKIDSARSELRILVYRAGPLARLGHNHVMVNRSLRGAVSLADAPDASVFRLIVPVAGFVVDDAQARREEGPDFDSEVPEEAKAGTLQNMRSAAVLDADEFPLITVASVALTAQPGAGGAGPMMAG